MTVSEKTQATVKYPKIKVKLTGADGNAFAIIGKVRKALLEAKISSKEIKTFQEESMSGDYNKLLATCMKWVTVL